MYDSGDNDLVFCPYNRYHVIRKLKIQKHISKCQKNYPHLKLATCIYNATHKVKPEEMLNHYEICPQKTTLEMSRYYNLESWNLLYSSTDENGHSFKLPTAPTKTDKDLRWPFQPTSGSVKKDPKFAQCMESPHTPPGKFSQEIGTKNLSIAKTLENGSEASDELKPLPLPKTLSKAFAPTVAQQGRLSNLPGPLSTHIRTQGRAKSLLKHLPPNPNSSRDDFPPEAKEEIGATRSLASTNLSCDVSVVSSMFDDATTFKSEEIIFDDNDFNLEQEDKSHSSLLKYFDQFVKL